MKLTRFFFAFFFIFL
ncbi:pheA operon leader peptide PheL [Salmonella sp. AM055]|nr:hypothetical protein [Salmonella enterica]EAP0379772.1 hypothetical protein [Salmonella enterica]EBQ7680079.1 hypothetical protein [Salmonella enterica]EDT7434729.1 hypothetical protein [Salmonella enterica subsp. enterica serovar Chincol]